VEVELWGVKCFYVGERGEEPHTTKTYLPETPLSSYIYILTIKTDTNPFSFSSEPQTIYQHKEQKPFLYQSLSTKTP